MKDRFYISCLQQNVGSNIAFHGANSGYTTDVSLAEVVSKEVAQQYWNSGRSYDVPMAADLVDEHLIMKVDSQRIPCKSVFSAPKSEQQYVAFKRQMWDGNDVYWLTENALDLDFQKAKILTINEAKKLSDGFVVLPFHIAEQNKRPTFSVANYSPRKMTQGAGIVMPNHAKKRK